MEALKNEITYGIMKDGGKKPLIWFDSYEKALKFSLMLRYPNTIIKREITYKVEAITGFYVNRESEDGEQ